MNLYSVYMLHGSMVLFLEPNTRFNLEIEVFERTFVFIDKSSEFETIDKVEEFEL